MLTTLLCCIGCGIAEQPGVEQEKVTWRFAIEESVGSVQHEYALEFERRIEEATDGRIDVLVYPYGSLGTSTQMTEQLNLGALEFAMCSPGSIGKFIPETQVFLLHFLLSDDDEVNQRVLSSPRILAAFDGLYADKGLKLLSIFPEGEMVWTTQKEIRSPDDFRGVKMRVMTSPILIDAYNAYGASATPLPYAEVYSALQLGMVDAQVNPIFAIERQKFYEVTDWLIFPGHAHFVTTAAANRAFYDALPPAERSLIDQTMAGLNDFIFEKQLAFQTERLKAIISDRQSKGARLGLVGKFDALRTSLTAAEQAELLDENPFLTIVQPLSPEERAAFAEASAAVKDTFLEIGGEHAGRVLDLIQAAVRDARDANR